MKPAFETDAFAVVLASQWETIINTHPYHYEGTKPYNGHPYTVFDGRCVVTIKTIGM